MKVTKVETLACDAGWRNYHFVKLTTDERHRRLERVRRGLRLARRRRRDRAACRRAWSGSRSASTSASMPSSIAPPGRLPAASSRRRIGAIENALLDAKAKALGVPCYELLGGKVRDRIRVYWSHCATWRINHPTYYKPAITDLDGVKAIGREVREKRLHRHEDQHLHLRGGRKNPQGLAPGLRRRRSIPSSTSTGTCCGICACTSKRSARAPGRTSICCSTSTSTPRPKAISKILRAIADLDMFWVEIDSFSPEALGYIRRAEPASDLVMRDAARPARVPALLPRAGHGRRDHRHAVERRVAVDEDRGARPRRTRSTSRRITSTATCAR